MDGMDQNDQGYGIIAGVDRGYGSPMGPGYGYGMDQGLTFWTAAISSKQVPTARRRTASSLHAIYAPTYFLLFGYSSADGKRLVSDSLALQVLKISLLFLACVRVSAARPYSFCQLSPTSLQA